MAYGNVTPPTLPTYDAETNGFYLLVFNYELGAENWYMVHLIYGAWRFQYEESVGITNTGNTFTRTYSDGVWSEDFGIYFGTEEEDARSYNGLSLPKGKYFRVTGNVVFEISKATKIKID